MFDILFTGDTFLKNKTDEGGSPFSSSVETLLRRSKNVCINLETTIGNGGKKVQKAFNFQAPPQSLYLLTDNNVRICSLANNHSLDFGQDGLKKTKECLEKEGIDYIGTEASNLKELNINGKRIGICAYHGYSKGLAMITPQKIEDDVKKAKTVLDYVIVCLHWGEEYVAYPSPKQQRLAHDLIDAGASVVVGHHPHVMQGYEEYHNGQIFYSLGNFNFFVDHPYAKKLVETTKAYCVGLNVRDDGFHCELVPIHINEDWQPCVITDDKEKKRFYEYIESISKPLSRNIKQKFFYIEVSPHYFNNHLYSWKKRIDSYGMSHFLEMIKWLIHPSIYKYYLGLVLSLVHKPVKY